MSGNDGGWGNRLHNSGGDDIFSKLKEIAKPVKRERLPKSGLALPIIGILAIAGLEGYALNRG